MSEAFDRQISVTMYLRPLLYESSEVFDGMIIDEKAFSRNSPGQGEGEELENPVKEKWEDFIRDIIWFIKEAGFTADHTHQAVDSEKAQCVISLKTGDDSFGSILFEMRISDDPLDPSIPENIKAKITESLKMNSVLDGTATENGIDFQVEKVAVIIESNCWSDALEHLFNALDGMETK